MCEASLLTTFRKSLFGSCSVKMGSTMSSETSSVYSLRTSFKYPTAQKNFVCYQICYIMSCVILHLYRFIFLLNCINENIEVTESRVLARPHLNEMAILILNSTGKLYNCYSSHIIQTFLIAAIFMDLLHKGSMSLVDTFLISLIR